MYGFAPWIRFAANSMFLAAALAGCGSPSELPPETTQSGNAGSAITPPDPESTGMPASMQTGGGSAAGSTNDSGAAPSLDAAMVRASDAALPPIAIDRGCHFENGAKPAFCEDFSGTAHPGGRHADLDARRWSVGRIAQPGWVAFPPTPASACQMGVSMATADHDILVCDAASQHGRQILTAMSAQNYAILSMRPRQAFDFAGRTGTIAVDVDALTEGGLSFWTSVFVTDEPYPGANDTTQVSGMVPRQGLGVNFDANCGAGSGNDTSTVGVGGIFVYKDYAETKAYAGTTQGPCVKTSRGKLNHVELRISQSRIEVWASDVSPDGGMTFPNFKRLAAADVSLSMTRGYVHFQQAERAPEKYKDQFHISTPYAQNYWTGLGFDGPVVASGEVGYEVPDALTTGPNGTNLGYALIASPSSTATCCDAQKNRTPVGPFALEGVDVQGVSKAMLTFSVTYTFGNSFTPATVGLKYRFNNRTWRTPSVLPDFNKATYCASCPFPPGNGNVAVGFALPVDLSDLMSGTNTLELVSTGTFDVIPAILANAELLVWK